MKLRELHEAAGPKVLNPKTVFKSTTTDGLNCEYQLSDLTSLEGSPQHVAGNFDCNNNELTSLKGGPVSVDKNFYCYGNKLTSLEHGPTKVGVSYSCMGNKLTNLIGAPRQLDGSFHANHNQLTSLEGVPEYLEGGLWCAHNKLTNLHNIHKHLKSAETVDFRNNPIKSHVLGLLLIDRLVEVKLDNNEVRAIITYYLDGGDVMECQQALLDAGLDEYAQL